MTVYFLRRIFRLYSHPNISSYHTSTGDENELLNKEYELLNNMKMLYKFLDYQNKHKCKY